MDWNNIEDIAIELAGKYPDTDPLTVRFTDLRQSIIGVLRTSPEIG